MKIIVLIAAATLCGGSIALPQRAWAIQSSGHPASAQMTALASTWRLVATRQRLTDGTLRPDPDLGPKPAGYLMFDARARQMCRMIANGDRPRWHDPSHPTDTEVRAIWDQTVAYCSTWSWTRRLANSFTG